MPRQSLWCIATFGLASSLAMGAPLPFSIIIQRDTVYKQTGPGAPTIPSGLDIFLKADPRGSFDGGTVDTPGTAGTVTLLSTFDSFGNPDLEFGSGLFTDQTAFNTMFPIGTDTFHLTDSVNPGNNTTQAFLDNPPGRFRPSRR